MNGNCYFSEGTNPTLTCNKNEGNRVAVPVGNIYESKGQAGTVYDSESCGPCVPGFGAGGGGKEMKVAIPVDVNPEVIGGIGEKSFGQQYPQGNRIYDGDKIATALQSNPVGNSGGSTNLYSVDVTGYNATLNEGGV